jgi:hypothetical protein
MKLYVDIKSPGKSVQKQFNTYYPFLKIEFFRNSANEKLSTTVKQAGYEGFLKNLFNSKVSGTIDVECGRTVAEVENDFKKQFGLSAQIFRRSGNVWIETTLTDDWTLEKQNKEGEQISSHFSQKLPETD